MRNFYCIRESDRKEKERKFLDHLNRASKIVESWPEWKKRAAGVNLYSKNKKMSLEEFKSIVDEAVIDIESPMIVLNSQTYADIRRWSREEPPVLEDFRLATLEDALEEDAEENIVAKYGRIPIVCRKQKERIKVEQRIKFREEK